MSRPSAARLHAIAPWLSTALSLGCNAPAGPATDSAAAPASATALPTTQLVAPSPASAASAPMAAPSELTSPIAASAPALKEAVAALTRSIADYGGHLGVA